ncbi:hypothetical protein CHUAL_012052 [Chamberlinius hualienensis]
MIKISNRIVAAKDDGVPRPFETLQQLIVVVKDINDADEEKTLAVDKLTGSIYTNRIQVVKIKIQVVLNIFVYVVDVNDNVPNFINSPYIAGISYDAPIGSIVINASAYYDPDILKIKEM